MNRHRPSRTEPIVPGGRASQRGRLVITTNEPEPRVLTLLWSMYLLIAAGATIFAVDRLWTYDPALFSGSSRVMLSMIGLGLGVLWPMVRLSQASPGQPAESVCSDAIALLVPAQAVVWPLTLLGGWSWGVTGAVALGMAAWTAAVGALIAHGTLRPSGAMRGVWMLMCLLVVGAAPIWAYRAGWTLTPLNEVDWRFGSPLTMGWGFTASIGGVRPVMAMTKWDGVLGPTALAAALWALYGLRTRLRGGTAPV